MSFTPRPFNSLHRLSPIRSLRVPQTFGHGSPLPAICRKQKQRRSQFQPLIKFSLWYRRASEWLWVKHLMNRGSSLCRGNKLFSSPTRTDQLYGPDIPSINQYRRRVVKRPGLEGGYSSSPEANNECRYTSIPPYAFTV
jgi:hypothetical protein